MRTWILLLARAVPLPTGEVLIGSELGITDELSGEATVWLKV